MTSTDDRAIEHKIAAITGHDRRAIRRALNGGRVHHATRVAVRAAAASLGIVLPAA